MNQSSIGDCNLKLPTRQIGVERAPVGHAQLPRRQNQLSDEYVAERVAHGLVYAVF